MTGRILLAIIFISVLAGQLYSQEYCIDGRFDTYVFDSLDVQITQNIQYGEAVNYDGVLQSIGMDIYFPDTTKDELEKKPAVMFVHGGGFTGGDKANGFTVGYDFVKKGFVFSSIDYRLGYTNLGDCLGDTTSLQLALYRAVQDTKAAIRYLKEHADTYGIDTNAIFLIGNSAGATSIIHAVFSEQEDFFQFQYDALGSIDSSTNTLYNHTTAVAGISCKAVGVQNLQIFEGETIPVQFFHGTCDDVIPYKAGPLYNCIAPVQYMYYHGSWDIAQTFEKNVIPYELYTNEAYDHTAVEDDTLLLYAGNFFKTILCNSVPLSTEYYRFHNDGCLVTTKYDYEISYSPNPFSDVIYVSVKGAKDESILVELYSYNGQRIYFSEEIFTAPETSIKIDLHKIATAKGIYFLRLEGNDIAETIKLVRQD